jgi:hypothetical protein
MQPQFRALSSSNDLKMPDDLRKRPPSYSHAMRPDGLRLTTRQEKHQAHRREVGGPFVADGWLGYFCFVVSPFM